MNQEQPLTMTDATTPQTVIRETNEAYFRLISEIFREEIQQFRSSQLTVAQFIQKWLDDGSVERFEGRKSEIAARVSQFWRDNTAHLTASLFRLDGLKCTVGSDIFPFKVQEKLLSVGCYFDTFVVQDYIRRIAIGDPTFSQRHASFGLVAFALEISRLESLFCTNLPLPPIVLLDQDSLNDVGFHRMMIERADTEMRSAMSQLFGRPFSSAAEAKKFLSGMPAIDDVCNHLVCASYSLREESQGSFREQLEHCIADASTRITK